MSVMPAISGPDYAAVMVMLLDDDDASHLLKQLSPEELRLLGQHMCALGEVAPQKIAQAIANFAEQADQQGLSDYGRVERVQRVMRGAVGEVKADNLMRRITPASDTPGPSAMDLVQWLDAKTLSALVMNEHPQAIAVMMVHLDPELAAEVLASLPEVVQIEVVHRVATLGPISAESIAMLEETLAAQIDGLQGTRPVEVGGVNDAAQIINNTQKAVSDKILPKLSKLDKDVAAALEEQMFRFERLYALGPKDMGVLLRDVDSEALVDALKGISEEEREYFFAAMSSRAADGVRDEIEDRGRLKRADVEAAQKKVIAVAKKLIAEGTLIMGDGEDDYV